MKIVADKNIPYIRETLEAIADEVVYLAGSEIGHEDVKDADALIVRTRTRCDKELLEGTRVRFVATATIGFDHIDRDYMEHAGIHWMSCPGCNADSVCQYMHSTLLLLKQERGVMPEENTLGVVGHGHVGSRVARMAREMGYRVMVCDPFLTGDFCNLEDIAREADVITFHTPLHRGEHPTWHLADKDFFDSLARVPYIINTSRGAVVSNDDLLDALEAGKVRDAVIDTWEGEPRLNLELLQRVYIGTPHIAGYSADGKTNADNMVVEELCRYFGLPQPEPITPPSLPEGSSHEPLALYNPHTDSKMLKDNPDSFEQLRNNYPLRREK